MQDRYLDQAIEEMKWMLETPSPTGYTGEMTRRLAARLSELGFEAQVTLKGTVITCLGGEGHPLVLTAHVDTLGGMVCAIKENGRLRMANIGGVSFGSVEGENMTVHTRDGRSYTGVYQTTSASGHVYEDNKTIARDAVHMELLLDELVDSAGAVRALGVSIGDVVSFDPRTHVTPSGFIKSRFLDDKLCAGALVALAQMVADGQLALNRKVYLMFTVYEEVGHGASASLPRDAEELLSVDMGCVGDDLDGSETKVSICAKDGRSPYDYRVTSALIETARRLRLPYAVDVFRSYASDADMALFAGWEVAHGCLGPGVYASHGYERTHVRALRATLELLEGYVGAQQL